MFLNDFSTNTISRRDSEFTEYCRLEGLDRLTVLRQLGAERKRDQPKDNAAAPQGLLESIPVVRYMRVFRSEPKRRPESI